MEPAPPLPSPGPAGTAPAPGTDALPTRLPGALISGAAMSGTDRPPGRTGTRVLRIRTTVARDRWYLDPAGRMCPGALLEAGQGDRLLTGRPGADTGGRGQRSYRLLDCDSPSTGRCRCPGRRCATRSMSTIPPRPPASGCSHSTTTPMSARNCVSSVRGGRAGLFTDQELREARGVLWNPEEDLARPALAPRHCRRCSGPVPSTRRRWSHSSRAGPPSASAPAGN